METKDYVVAIVSWFTIRSHLCSRALLTYLYITVVFCVLLSCCYALVLFSCSLFPMFSLYFVCCKFLRKIGILNSNSSLIQKSNQKNASYMLSLIKQYTGKDGSRILLRGRHTGRCYCTVYEAHSVKCKA